MTHYRLHTTQPLTVDTDFCRDFTNALRVLGDQDENAPYEVGRQFRELFGEQPSPAAESRSDVGYYLESVLQTEGTIALEFAVRGETMTITVQRGRLPPHPSIEFSTVRNEQQQARALVGDVLAYQHDQKSPFDGLSVGICRRHERVRVATNAMDSSPEFGRRYSWLRRARNVFRAFG